MRCPIWLALLPTASATSCLPLSLAEHYAGSTDVRSVTITAAEVGPDWLTYTATVDAVYAGCSAPGDVVTHRTTLDDDAQLLLEVGSNWLLGTGPDGFVNVCTLHVAADAVPEADRAFLESREVACAGTCWDGSAPLACPADACADAACGGAPCAANPCAGCALEFTFPADGDGGPTGIAGDRDGDRTCDPQDLCAAGDDRADADADGVPDACDPPDPAPRAETAETGGPTGDTGAPAARRQPASGGCGCAGGGPEAGLGGLAVAALALRWRPRPR